MDSLYHAERLQASSFVGSSPPPEGQNAVQAFPCASREPAPPGAWDACGLRLGGWRRWGCGWEGAKELPAAALIVRTALLLFAPRGIPNQHADQRRTQEDAVKGQHRHEGAGRRKHDPLTRMPEIMQAGQEHRNRAVTGGGQEAGQPDGVQPLQHRHMGLPDEQNHVSDPKKGGRGRVFAPKGQEDQAVAVDSAWARARSRTRRSKRFIEFLISRRAWRGKLHGGT